MPHSILLIEDEENLNRAVSLKLGREGYTVHSAFTIAQGERLLDQVRPDLVICDIGLPDGNGLDFCEKVRRDSKVLFLFLTALDTEPDIVTGYEAGADDYITKPFSLMVLISKVNAMMKRTAARETERLESGAIALLPREGRAEKAGQPLALTPNEWKLLRCFLNHPRQILSRGQMLDALWDNESDYIDENALAVNIRRLREKIEDDASSPVYIKNIRGMGYIWDMECRAL